MTYRLYDLGSKSLHPFGVFLTASDTSWTLHWVHPFIAAAVVSFIKISSSLLHSIVMLVPEYVQITLCFTALPKEN